MFLPGLDQAKARVKNPSGSPLQVTGTSGAWAVSVPSLQAHQQARVWIRSAVAGACMGSLMDVGVVNSSISHRDVFWFLFDFFFFKSGKCLYTGKYEEEYDRHLCISVNIYCSYFVPSLRVIIILRLECIVCFHTLNTHFIVALKLNVSILNVCFAFPGCYCGDVSVSLQVILSF